MAPSSLAPLRPSWFNKGRLYRVGYFIRLLYRARAAPSYVYDPRKVLVFLISRDLFSCLSSLVASFSAAGVLEKNIFIIDQGTTNDRCKAVYKSYQKRGINVLSLSERSQAFGPYVVWLDDLIAALVREHGYPYIVTDTDLHFRDSFPADWLIRMFDVLNKYKAISKVALPLQTDDIDVDNRRIIINHENTLGASFVYPLLRALLRVPTVLRVCQTDTTLALYRPGLEFSTISIRLEPNYSLQHMPWYRCFVCSHEYDFYRRNKRSEFGMWS